MSENEPWRNKVPWYICSKCWPELKQEGGFYFGNDEEIEKFWKWWTYNFFHCEGCPELNWEDR